MSGVLGLSDSRKRHACSLVAVERRPNDAAKVSSDATKLPFAAAATALALAAASFSLAAALAALGLLAAASLAGDGKAERGEVPP